jgi:hypothetical protein
MALGVEDMRAGRVVLKTTLLTVGTLGFTFCLTLLYLSMRSVMDVGGFCASGGPYEIRQTCPQGVAWMMPVSIFGLLVFAGISVVGAFSEGGPRPYAFAWSALFLALGWNFLDYGFNPPDGGTSASWLVCGVVFVLMGGVPLALLLWKSAARWVLWGPRTEKPVPEEGWYHLTPVSDTATMPTAAGGLMPMRPAGPEPQPEPSPTPASTTTVQDARPSGDMVGKLERLADLHERGALNESEYEMAKNAILHDEVQP